MSQSDCRAYHRWRCEGGRTSLWAADRFLIRYGGHIDEFMAYCLDQGLQVWAAGQEPEWLGKDLSAEDLMSSDPQWSREARCQSALDSDVLEG
ncbi:MAG: hypothetical protein QOI31_1696 [Solirubrobacterales bacterium]|jgi:hypothetical protein|nr:hypothetical protein [Solirubrobacterales bacterium]